MTAQFQATTQNDASSMDACGWNNHGHSHQQQLFKTINCFTVT